MGLDRWRGGCAEGQLGPRCAQPVGRLSAVRAQVRCTGRVDEGLTMRHAALGAGALHPEAPRCPSAPLPQSWSTPSSQDKNGSTQGPWELVTPPVCQEIDFGSCLLVSGCGKRGESCQPGACPGNSKSRSSARSHLSGCSIFFPKQQTLTHSLQS